MNQNEMGIVKSSERLKLQYNDHGIKIPQNLVSLQTKLRFQNANSGLCSILYFLNCLALCLLYYNTSWPLEPRG